MRQHWNVQKDSLEIAAMPFYWRLSSSTQAFPGIADRLPVHLKINSEFDYLELDMTKDEWENLERAYRKNANIGFINPESGQINTYGSSVNSFFLAAVQEAKPQKIFEIGCGAGFSIMFMRENGWDVTGIDPSDYSLQWSKKLEFKLLQTFFDAGTLKSEADFIFCNDVFEHVRDVVSFSKNVFKALKIDGTFCFATTNSTRSIAIGDISMLEHQHVNMFTERSIFSILKAAGFGHIRVGKGSYGNTFHVTAQKVTQPTFEEIPQESCAGYLKRAAAKIDGFAHLYKELAGHCHFYVPLRCLPYLATVGDFGKHEIYDSNKSWSNKYIDGYGRPIRSLDDAIASRDEHFFIGSMTFHEEIKKNLMAKGFAAQNIHGITELGQ